MFALADGQRRAEPTCELWSCPSHSDGASLADVMAERRRFFGHATARWVRTVFTVVDHPHDVKTISNWGKLAGASPSVLRSVCLMAHVGPKNSLDFARILRLFIQNQIDHIEESLNVSDPRTLRRLLDTAGIPPAIASPTSADIFSFIEHQRFIANPTALTAVKEALDSRCAGDSGILDQRRSS